MLQAKFRGARVGLVCHQASRTAQGIHAAGLLAKNSHWYLTTLFGPEHGVAAAAAQDMECVVSGRDPATGLPAYSLYGDGEASLIPTPAMLRAVDVLAIDLQDIGARYYTYIYTTAFCLQACAALHKPVLVCDRPNPIGGATLEGPLSEPGFRSFVGWYPLPVRHGMTIGEAARYFNVEHRLRADLTVLPMDGWRRDWLWDDTGLAWVNPSPNMRSLAAALLYPGLCLLEATNVAEGRGTPTPFEHCGAPWIDGPRLAREISTLQLPGIHVEPTTFCPGARKYAGTICQGVRFTITDRDRFTPYAFGLALLSVLRAFDGFRWRDPHGDLPDDGPYEFVTDRPAIDLLTGSARVREAIDARKNWPEIAGFAGLPSETFQQRRKIHLLY
ncbi:MAG: DUF1343 domain-containing protein [Deltaproteobacteria bacterium]|nr:DUF1343 domain-containing protein [Deltaproteobacteria bacterium]